MKTIVVLSGIIVISVTVGFAGGEAIVKQRAKDLSNQNNVRQGVPPATGQPSVAAPAAAPSNSAAVAKFQADLATISVGTPVTSEQKQLIARDLQAMALGASRRLPQRPNSRSN